ncbi:MAG: hypothetical protein VX899_07825 [Myxococcota bacterium]|nr:hypothetical protein [Myxococcota bacterium]
MDERFLARIRALNDPDLNQVLAHHQKLHVELDSLQQAVWLSEDDQRRLAQLKRTKLRQKDKLLRLVSELELGKA